MDKQVINLTIFLIKDYVEEFKDCCTAIYYEDITNTGYFANVNNVELNNCIDILNEKAIKYLGKYFCYLEQLNLLRDCGKGLNKINLAI